MADNAAEKKVEKPEEAPPAPVKKSNGLLIGLVVFNMLVVIGVGALLYLDQKERESATRIEDFVEGAGIDDASDAGAESMVGKIVHLDSFLVNLSGSKGHKVLKVTMELEVENNDVQDEVERRKPQIRDIIIILLSSKTYGQVSTPTGKEELKEEIRDTVNTFLTRGKVNKVLFTKFIFN